MSAAKDELYALDVADARWRKSSKSLSTGDCVQVAELAGGAVAVRDSRHPERGDLRFTPQEWTAFCAGVRDGEFD
ncbi:DUF397 domain-containing protein [Streptomyces sp. Ru73]|uniref:DUF397 domain-containing protein n=1 Tax=Streptomyces sp. Ru73 TaxID=2080748 RepID=UPI000CDCF997|nr:DUF397 domain-containing protein [Streptomyces sp. Ru73]POX37820.1 DUF397 domain-containing protein [Streptomyces sp. Ru73]